MVVSSVVSSFVLLYSCLSLLEPPYPTPRQFPTCKYPMPVEFKFKEPLLPLEFQKATYGIGTCIDNSWNHPMFNMNCLVLEIAQSSYC